MASEAFAAGLFDGDSTGASRTAFPEPEAALPLSPTSDAGTEVGIFNARLARSRVRADQDGEKVILTASVPAFLARYITEYAFRADVSPKDVITEAFCCFCSLHLLPLEKEDF